MWIFSGCGSSYYLAQTGSALFEKISGIRARAVPASDVLISPEYIFNPSEKYVFVGISRSGTTTEIIRALQKSHSEFQVPTVAVSCTPNSILCDLSDGKITFPFQEEKSVVMTGSFSTMLLSIIYLASLHSEKAGTRRRVMDVPERGREIVQHFDPILSSFFDRYSPTHFVFLGQGPYYGIANEAALKMQEMSISLSQSYQSLEYRHGPMSTAGGDTLITILSSRQGTDLEIELAKDMKSLGAAVLALYGKENSRRWDVADVAIAVGSDADLLNPLFYLPILQLLAFYRALSKNINPDKPRNLTAVVELNI
ncbi:MAG TPA: SIS domain-containing protein [Caldithrix sp.]|nr:SIS domain-containing protein [Caldithrix sp.]